MEIKNWKDVDLNKKQKKVSDRLLEKAKKKNKMFEGMVKMRIRKSIIKIFKLRNLRSKVFGEENYMEKCEEINEEIEKEISFLKKNGLPYHPIICNKVDWEAA